MRDYAKITEAQKPLLVSGILIALMDLGFQAAYIKYEGEELAEEAFKAVKKQIEKAELGENQNHKKKAIMNAFSFIEHHPELHKVDKKRDTSPLLHIIQELDLHVRPFTKDYYDFDIIGNFYGEFIRYTGGDGKGLGIVLTPKHITELFAELAKVNKNSVVLDICAGTSGFLISAMKKMTKDVSAAEKKKILENNLIGIEQEPQMFALAVSNMILRGDGKTNLYQGSCFDEELFDKVKDKASVGFINPPYSQKGDNLHEWDFIIHMLDGLRQNSVGIAIVPMSLAIAPHPLREKLLGEHRLEAVMSMPDDLFYPVGVVTCIMVFTAHVPHESDEHHESWFGYWKDDGFVKDKKEGRIDRNKKWEGVKNKWISDFRKKEEPGISVWKKVGISDEWCAEAYLETDYSSLKVEDFTKEVEKYFIFKLTHKDLL
jgi:type I restriction-modification system DNA methylase subunit